MESSVLYFTFLEIYIFFLKNDWNRKTFFINTVFLWEITKNRIVPRSFSRNWRIIKDRNEPKHCLQNAIWNMQKMQYETQFAVWKWCLCFLFFFFVVVHLFVFPSFYLGLDQVLKEYLVVLYWVLFPTLYNIK